MNLSYNADPVLRSKLFDFVDEIGAYRVACLLFIYYLYIVKHNK